MTMMQMPVVRAPRLQGLGDMLARLAAGEQPALPSVMAQPSGSGGNILMGALQGAPPLPAPAPRQQSASPGSGGVAAPPVGGGEPVRPQPSSLVQPSEGQPDPAMPQKFLGMSLPQGMSKGQIIAGIVGDMLAGAAGRPGTFAPMMQQRRELEDQRNHEEVKWHRDRQAKREDDMRPRIEKVGDALGTYNPAAQTFEPIYTNPQPFEDYARARGFEPGTSEYGQAVEDYRLGAWSDPAVENRTEFEQFEADEREALETMRAANRLRDIRERLAVTRRGQDMTDARVRRGQDIGSRDRVRGQDVGSRDRRGSATYQGRGGRGGRGNAARAVNPQTGEALVLRNGQWVPER